MLLSAVKTLELERVSKRFVKPLDLAERIAGYRPETVQAVDNVSFAVDQGEVVGLVGESGCGKSTLGRIAAGILEPSEGEVRYRGGKPGLKVQMIFQDPFASLNPRMRVADIVGEAPLVHGIVGREALEDYVDELLLRCGLDPGYKRRYPHQFSGGQRSRIGIARTLAVQPEFLVCDEAVAALDVSIQAQILNLFMALRRDLNLTYLFISHDLGVVEHLSDRVVIMYLGRVVECAPTEQIFSRANHPYTQALLRQVPRLETRKTKFQPIVGEIPSPLAPPSGCHFHPRCPHAKPICKEQAPALREIGPGHLSACHLNA
ncbi:MAG: ABC transporter ATP-binding protein [Betaproteobacteria bacterium]